MSHRIAQLIPAIASVALLLFSTAVPAQVAEKRTLTLAGAEKVLAAALSEARRLKTTGAIAVVDDGGNLLALSRIDRGRPHQRRKGADRGAFQEAYARVRGDHRQRPHGDDRPRGLHAARGWDPADRRWADRRGGGRGRGRERPAG